MTPGETALWLRRSLGLDVSLRVARMAGYAREPGRRPDWPPWIPPSPSIVSWESAMCFHATVFFEALPGIDHARRTALPFQCVGAPWTRGRELEEFLEDLRLPGVRFHAHRYASRPPTGRGRVLDGIRLTVTDADAFRPALCGVSIVHALQRLYGRNRVWVRGEARPDFFDKLFGARSVREAILDGEAPRSVAARWMRDLARFRRTRAACRLYETGGAG
jgi:uncharacterized protein YbbC (DUF1343 family)